MNKIQQKYSAFMESVCTQFNCKQALPALKQGFKAFCESVDVDYDPFDIDNMVANASDAEFGAENNDSRYNIDRVTGQGSVDFDEGDADDTNVAIVAQRLAKRLQTLFERNRNRGNLTVIPSEHRNNCLEIQNNGYFMGMVEVTGNTVKATYPGHCQAPYNLDSIRDLKDGISEFDLDEPQLADKVAEIYLTKALEFDYDRRHADYVDDFVYSRRVLNAGADMNDDEFADALRNNKFDHLRYKNAEV